MMMNEQSREEILHLEQETAERELRDRLAMLAILQVATHRAVLANLMLLQLRSAPGVAIRGVSGELAELAKKCAATIDRSLGDMGSADRNELLPIAHEELRKVFALAAPEAAKVDLAAGTTGRA